jgi:hypothetical protein
MSACRAIAVSLEVGEPFTLLTCDESETGFSIAWGSEGVAFVRLRGTRLLNYALRVFRNKTDKSTDLSVFNEMYVIIPSYFKC